jgi:predicted nucleic acid-binding protein
VIFLLDVNVLLALSYDDHVHNARARQCIGAAERGSLAHFFTTQAAQHPAAK